MEYLDPSEQFGRHIIKTDFQEINENNVVQVLTESLTPHFANRTKIIYLWKYYKGDQPILQRTKTVRPEICNKIVENRANEIVSFKTGYLMGEPLQYVSRDGAGDVTESINKLNQFVFAEEKASKDMELAEMFHVCGTAYRMIIPDKMAGADPDEAPFEIYTLNPWNTFVVYTNDVRCKPILGVTYVVQRDGSVIYTCYSDKQMFTIKGGSAALDGLNVSKAEPHILGDVPIIEYPLNRARIGAFELVLPLLDAINKVESNRLDGVEQFIEALVLFHNVDIDEEKFAALKEMGGIKFKDLDPNMKGEVTYLNGELSQTNTQTLSDNMYQAVLTICGMPNRNGGSSTSDTGSAVIMRDGWSDAEARAKDTELMFKKSERQFLRVALNICSAIAGLKLKVSDIEIRFTRRNYENVYQKAQVLDLMLKNEKINPKLAFSSCGLFVDSELAYSVSMDYVAEQEKKQQELMASASQNNPGDGNTNGTYTQTREPSGSENRTGESSGSGS